MAETETELTEPVLPMDDIQGIAVPGFFKPHQTLLGVACDDKPSAIDKFKVLLRETADEISSAARTLADRRDYRKNRNKKGAKSSGILTAIGFTFPGLHKLTPGAIAIPSEAFQQGMAARSEFLGDPKEHQDEGNPSNWKVGGPNNGVDALVVIGRRLIDDPNN